MWSDKRALQVYTKIFPLDRVADNDPRRESIVNEMNAGRFAPTPERAAMEIAWWGWDDEFTALDAARRIRRFKA